MLDTKRSHTKGAISTTGGVVILALSAYHVLGSQMPPWVQSLTSFVATVFGVILVGVIVWATWKETFSPHTATKIRQWHTGQFAIFWLGTLFGAGLLGATIAVLPHSVTRQREVQCPVEKCGSVPNQFGQIIPYTKWIEVRESHPNGDLMRGIGGVILLVGVPLTLLGVSWVWFGGCPRRGT